MDISILVCRKVIERNQLIMANTIDFLVIIAEETKREGKLIYNNKLHFQIDLVMALPKEILVVRMMIFNVMRLYL